ncbi:uncharacterized protein LOC143461694 isoform X2 [Clavelina lepadiformis]|uniref:uncharacterized protein LOC143461694 isoform X2 n=1 Tax=Clavelina lepadiformis TaxID=159417 RepID=UPI00404251F1
MVTSNCHDNTATTPRTKIARNWSRPESASFQFDYFNFALMSFHSILSIDSCHGDVTDTSPSSSCKNESYVSSQTSSMVTLPSLEREGNLLQDEINNSDDGLRHNDLARKKISVRFRSGDENKSSLLTSRATRKMRRSLKDADFPLSDVNADKSTASQAVAFVIRASRRGVVPLCAEVADLLKEKRRLENLVEEQKREIQQLLENQALPRSPSPPPPEMTHFSMQTVQEMDCQTICLTDVGSQTDEILLPCTQIKSLEECEVMESPNSIDIKGIRFECGKKLNVRCLCPKLTTSSTQNPVQSSVGTGTSDRKYSSDLGYFDHRNLEHRHKQLETRNRDLKVLSRKRSDKNVVLESELSQAKKEIVSLQQAIQNIQLRKYENERRRVEDDYSVDVQYDDESLDDVSDDVTMTKYGTSGVSNQRDKGIVSLSSPRSKSSASSSIFPGPILGCKCQMCTSFFKSSGLLGFASSPYVTDSSGRNPVLRDLRKLIYLQNSKLRVHMNDQVLFKGNKVGLVRYLGHLDAVRTANVVYVGLELDTADGLHDGYLNGKRYFFTKQKHGLFLPLQDITCVISKKVALPVVSQRPALTASRQKKHSNTPSRGKIVIPHKQKSSSPTSSGSETSSDDRRLPTVTQR